MAAVHMIDHASMLRPRARGRFQGYLIALSIALAAAAVGRAAYSAHRDAEAISVKNEQLRAQQAAMRREPSREDQEFRRQWGLLQQDRAYPWEKVFRAVERASDPEIELLEFRPDRRQGTLVLKGEGRSGESVMRYLERLQEDATFTRAFLIHTASVERGRLVTRDFEVHLSLSPQLSGMH